MKKDFITTSDFSQQELLDMITTGLNYKKGQKDLCATDKILTLIFANPSLRTRVSFESGMKKLGGSVNTISTHDAWNFEYETGGIMNGSTQEHIIEAAQVLSAYSDLIGFRKSELITSSETQKSWDELKKDIPIKKLAQYANKPVINMESNMYHPCQAMADMMTIIEKLIEPQKKKYVLTWAPHPKPLPLATPHSQLITPTLFDMDVTLCCPPGFELDKDIMNTRNVTITHDQETAFKNADVIVAKSWASLKYFGDWEAEQAHRKNYNDWIITPEKIPPTALFLHCLPIRRNVVASESLIESPQSALIHNAENRMWAQMGIISHLLTQSSC